MTFKELRQQSGMTQKEIAEYFEIPKRTIESWDEGARKCPDYLLKLIEYKLVNEGKIKGESKMKTYAITTKNGKIYKWTFEECETDPNDYGNKRYISYITPSGDAFLLDCRYLKNYNFNKICVDFLHEWYGENLAELCEED